MFIVSALHENNWRHGLKDQDDDTANLLLTWKDGAIRCEQVSPRNGAKLTDVECTKLEQPLNWIQLRSQLNEPFDFRMSRTLEGTISVEANVMVSAGNLNRLSLLDFNSQFEVYLYYICCNKIIQINC